MAGEVARMPEREREKALDKIQQLFMLWQNWSKAMNSATQPSEQELQC
jgi:hypothetical protein